MKRTLMISTLFGLMTILGAGAAQAGPGHGRHGHGKHGHGKFGGMMCPKMIESLGLNAKQQAEIKQLKAEMKEDTKGIHDQLKNMREQLHALWNADQPDEAAILELQRKMDPLRSQLRERRTEFRLDMMRVLTAEQRKQFKSMKKGGDWGGSGCPGRGHGRGRR